MTWPKTLQGSYAKGYHHALDRLSTRIHESGQYMWSSNEILRLLDELRRDGPSGQKRD